jgi:hypothetical protein
MRHRESAPPANFSRRARPSRNSETSEPALLLADAINGKHTRMIQSAQHARFILKPAHRV